ncbi:hypothetical protein MMC27_008572 [Xylographa pallens]|nr:hypothetical protein [Xylographa pallens]
MADSGLRLRPTTSSKSKEILTPTTSDSEEEEAEIHRPESLSRTRISVLDVFRVLGGLFLLSCALSYFITNDSIFWGHRPSFTRPAWLKARVRGPLLLTEAELSKYDGTDPALPIYLALNSSIYDVSASPHFYGPGGSYHFFAGRDATRAFVTGCFEEDLNGDLRGVEEMFVPLELEDQPQTRNMPEGRARTSRGRWKVDREKAYRKGREKVKDMVEQWRQTFDGGKEGKYFWVGTVKREAGWEGPKKLLCEKAAMNRPKTKAEAV